MEFALAQALLAGLAGVLAMMVGMRIATGMGMTNMPPMPLIIGGMVTDDPLPTLRFTSWLPSPVTLTVVVALFRR